MTTPPQGQGDGNGKVAAVVLAAGRSARMGGDNKLLADLNGKPLLTRVVDNLLPSQAALVLVVTGHQAEAARAVLAGRAVTFVHADDFAAGLSASLRAGLRALPADVDAALICLGDMPGVGPAVVDRLIAAYRLAGVGMAGGTIVRPLFRGRAGNPVLWGRRYFPAMMALEGDKGARDLLLEHSPQVIGVETGTAGVLADVDTPEMLGNMRQNWRDFGG